MKGYENRLYYYTSDNKVVGKGTATFDSIMLCSALSDVEKDVFREWAAQASPGESRWISDIEFKVRHK